MRQRNNGVAVAVVVICAVLLVYIFIVGHGPLPAFAYGAIAIAYLLMKLAGSVLYRTVDVDSNGALDGMRVAVAIPVYNEDPSAFAACLSSILLQDRHFDEIYVIDDGSASTECIDLAARMLSEAVDHPAYRVVYAQEHNMGKRHALAVAFDATTCDLIMTVDSDTELAPSCLAEALAPFADPEVMAVTGTIRAANFATNLLTRLIDLRYANAFLYERAAYSRFGGNVLCCCGSMTLWRTSVIKEELDDFVAQQFLGITVSYGDDRRLTNYALQRGRVVIQTSAVAYTLVPERMSHFVRQQLRWNKSFFRESLWLLRTFSPRRGCWWLGLLEVAAWFGFSIALTTTLVVRPALGQVGHLWLYLALLIITSYARSARYLGAPGGKSLGVEAAVFALAPLYGFLHYFLLMPLRWYALSTLKQGKWGTRETVEVAAADSVRAND